MKAYGFFIFDKIFHKPDDYFTIFYDYFKIIYEYCKIMLYFYKISYYNRATETKINKEVNYYESEFRNFIGI